MPEIRDRLAAVPDAVVERTPEVTAAIADSVAYLDSDDAARSIVADTYWPKWNSPWWHMLLLWELGEAAQIPARAVTTMIDGLNALPIKIFPIHPQDTPAGADPYRHSSCHCAVGSIAQVLAAAGVDVDRALPWIPPWFSAYQMADGGLNCDGDAYLVKDETPSSMVGTVPLFEAALLRPRHPFADRAASFLIDRALIRGSSSQFNAVERDAALEWPKPTFPRFYFYDVLRGLAALVQWAEREQRTIPHAAVADAVDYLLAAFPDGVVRVQRRAYDDKTTLARKPDGGWHREPTSTFPLLDAVGRLGTPSEALTRQWTVTRAALRQHLD